MTVRELFWRRWKDHAREQLSAVRSVVDDAIVLIYIGIPAVLLLGRAYYGWWREPLPEWILHLPAAAVPAFLFLLMFSLSGLILFIEPADSLFLRQQRRWHRGLIVRGMIIGSLTAYIRMAFIFLLLAPFLIRGYGVEWGNLLQLFGVTCAVQTTYSLMSNLMRVNFARWKRRLGLSIIGSLVSAAYLSWYFMMSWKPVIFWVILAGCLGLSIVLVRIRLGLVGKSELELREELHQRTRFTALLLSQSVPPFKPERSRPWLFRGSRRLLRSQLPGDRVAEAVFKSFFRGTGLQTYAVFSLAGCIAVFLPPFPVNLIVYVGVVLLLAQGINASRLYFFRSPLMQIMHGTKEAELASAARSMRMLLYPALTLITSVFMFSATQVWWGLLIGLAAGYLVSRIAGSIVPVLFSTGFLRRKSSNNRPMKL